MSFKKSVREIKEAYGTLKLIVGTVGSFVGGITLMCLAEDPTMFRSGVCLIVAALFVSGMLGFGLYSHAKKRADSLRSPGEVDIEASVANENAFPEVKTELKPEGESLYGIAIITLCTFGVPVLMYFYLQAVMYTFDYTLLAMLSAPFVLIGMTVLGFYTYGYFVGSPDKTKDKNNITR